ncbi:hypothetical protein DesLBE_3670 [Desulfitobacterium sp. LBE]|jgi:hypothetical protein|uniref:hypothetical protein n=1 Tax=Desulfitobacterium sp. LBE TaxID=884086 RepID=UPI00119A3C5A|nr:hypothetical protein [Desulfitobacterium sp. LBE]TWH59295.1 hypothetical protein DesLBE_3670 [Desulfitobacterium sp. LBE]
MLTKKQFYHEFFKRLKKMQLTAKEPEIADITAEIFNEAGGLVALITADDRLVYQGNDNEQFKRIGEIVAELKVQLNLSTDLSVKTIGYLPSGFMKLYEVGDVVMGCRLSPLIGYEYVTWIKGSDNELMPVYFYARQFLSFKEAQQDFAERCGFIEQSNKADKATLFTNEELSILLSCCIERVKLDTALTTEVEKAIGDVISKIERTLPMLTDDEIEYENENVRCFR